MLTATRKRRKDDKPLDGKGEVITTPSPRDLRIFQSLDSFLGAKYATTSWLYYHIYGIPPFKQNQLSETPTPEELRRVYHYQGFSRRVGLLRQTQNSYIEWPQEQRRVENYLYKDAVLSLGERGMSALVERGLANERSNRKSGRIYPYAPHRSRHFPHELGVDLIFTWPLRYALDHCGTGARAIRLPALLEHPSVPESTRNANNPFTVQLRRSGYVTFDPMPVVICARRSDHGEDNYCIPGIQYDRGTKSNAELEKQVDQALEYVDDKYYERQWGFDTCVIPFFFTQAAKMQRSKEHLKIRRPNGCRFILFKKISDPYSDEFFPPLGDDTITTTFERVGYPDYFLLKPNEQ